MSESEVTVIVRKCTCVIIVVVVVKKEAVCGTVAEGTAVAKTVPTARSD